MVFKVVNRKAKVNFKTEGVPAQGAGAGARVVLRQQPIRGFGVGRKLQVLRIDRDIAT